MLIDTIADMFICKSTVNQAANCPASDVFDVLIIFLCLQPRVTSWLLFVLICHRQSFLLPSPAVSCSCCSPCAALPISVGSGSPGMNDSGFQVQSSKSWIGYIAISAAADTVPLATTTIPARTPHERSTRGGQRRATPLLSPSRPQ